MIAYRPRNWFSAPVSTASQRHFPHTVLMESGLVNDFVADQPVLVYFDPITATALAFDRSLDGQELTFELL